MWDLQRLTTLWVFTAWYRDSFTFLLLGKAVFLKTSATALRCMDTLHTHGLLSGHNISLGRKRHTIAAFSANSSQVAVKAGINRYQFNLLNDSS
jgi:hypothetical protein